MFPPTSLAREPRQPLGITLLEVLIACGLLIIGLSTMAALLPAAGSRLAQAGIEDRAGVLVANALAELTNRGLLAADAFEGSSRALVLGSVLDRLPELPAAELGGQPLFTGLSAEARARCGSPRTFRLEDELVYDPPRLLSTPVNAFTTTADGVGPRRFRDTMCWGAMISPRSLSPVAGDLARLAIATFRKQLGADQVMPVTLTRSLTHYEATDLLADDSLLAACSWVLAIPKAPLSGAAAEAPRWFQVMSSWRQRLPADPTPRVIFRDQVDFQQFTGTAAPESAATVLAFEGLVRVDERDVILD